MRGANALEALEAGTLARLRRTLANASCGTLLRTFTHAFWAQCLLIDAGTFARLPRTLADAFWAQCLLLTRPGSMT